jgi:hypothetical protein
MADVDGGADRPEPDDAREQFPAWMRPEDRELLERHGVTPKRFRESVMAVGWQSFLESIGAADPEPRTPEQQRQIDASVRRLMDARRQLEEDGEL